nr:uncharacterized protein LOC129381036 [Dermacentor andersoni]
MMEQFLETVRLFPFLYDKTHPEYKDKDAKMNRWAIIGRTFDLTARKQVAHLFILQPFLVINSGISVGPQAAAKFKNVKDRWLKIVSASEGARKSGAGGEAGKVHTKWALFDIVDGMLRHTPHYAESSILPSPLSTNSPSSPGLVARYSDSPNDFTDEDDLSERCLGQLLSYAVRTKKKHEMPAPTDDSHEAANWIAAKLRMLPHKKRCEVTFKIHKLLYEAEMEQYE